jgi:hypothetical protein
MNSTPKYAVLTTLHSVEWGGHFAAMEAPGLLVGDMRKYFRRLR